MANIIRYLTTCGNMVRTPDGSTGMVRAYDRRHNVVSVQLAATGMREAITDKAGDFVARLREAGLVRDYHFSKLRVVGDE